MELNMDIQTRDEIIFGEYNPKTYSGGYRSFSGMTASKLKKLVEMGFADPEDAQNNSPTIEEFIEFAENNEGFIFNGYAIDDSRSDYRVSIESIEKDECVTADEKIEFLMQFRYADEITVDDGLYAWWD